MRKHLLLFLAFFLTSTTIWANTIYFNIAQENSVSQIQTDLQTVIDNATSNDTIIVTGSKTNADVALVLTISTGKTVIWQATYQSGTPFGANDLLSFSGNGTFEVANGTLITENANSINAAGSGSTVIVSGTGKVQTSGDSVHAIITNGNVEIKAHAQISGTTGEVIYSEADNVVITVSGGSVTATSENAICALGRDAKIFVTGGYVSNDANDIYPTIVAHDPRPDSESLVHISGTGRVEAKGMGCAITSSNVKVSGNAQVSNNAGGSDGRTAAVRGSLSVEVSDNAKVSASNNYAIISYRSITVGGNSIIEAKEDAIAIYLYGEGALAGGYIGVKDQAQVIAANSYSISHNVPSFFIEIAGGVVFAYGNDKLDVISEPHSGTSYSGIILAWNKEAGNTNYEVFSTDDIFKLPESATAYWDKKGAQSGISYSNGDNTGFIPLGVNVLSIGESLTSNTIIYPNPTTGILKVETQSEVSLNDIVLFDMLGKNMKANIHITKQETINSIVIDFSHLPSGIYSLKMKNEAVKIIKH